MQEACVLFVVYLHLLATFITKQKSLGWSKINIQVHGILQERGNIKHTQMKQCNFIILEPGCGTVYFYITFTLIMLKYLFEFASMVRLGSREASWSVCLWFYGAQV